MRSYKQPFITFNEALGQAIRHKQASMLACKQASRNKLAYRVNRFVADGYNPYLGWQGSISAYLTHLEQQGKSKSYVRGVRSTLLSVSSYLPTHQPNMLGGAL